MSMMLCGLGGDHSSGAAMAICYRLLTDIPNDVLTWERDKHLHCILYLTV